MLYNQIVGQKETKDHLIKMIRENRIPHALLFSGKEGCGNLSAALAFAQHLFCTNKKENSPCGECSPCLKVSKLIHPDLHFVFPITKTKDIKKSDDLLKEFREAFLSNSYLTIDEWLVAINAENKQPLIPVEEANDILRKLSYTSYEGSYKVMIIWLPEKMNADSANKLLKILEEPPEKTIFVLVTNSAEHLLATILSRVQLIQFYDCGEQEISEALVKQFGVTEEIAAQNAMLAQGSYSEAISLLNENEESVSFLSNFQTFMRLALRFDCGKALLWVDENAIIGRERQKQFLQYALEVFRDSLMFNYGDKSLVRLSGQEKAFLEKFAPFINQNNYERLVEEFNNNYYYIQRNANPKILFTDLLLTTNELINQK